MKYFLFLVITIWALYVRSQQNQSIQNKVNTFVNDLSLETASVSFMAVDLATGETVASFNEKKALVPASTVKLFTTASAFKFLGPLHRPVTRFYFDGDLDTTGVLNGNLIVKGGGDPSLGSRYFEQRKDKSNFINQWADSLIALGVKEINGAVIADASDFGYYGAPAGWTWGDMGNYYGAGPSGCTIYDNTVYLQFKTGKSVGDSTTLICTEPYLPNLTMTNYVKSASSRRDNSYVFGAPFLNNRFIEGSLPMRKDTFEVKGSIPDPELLMAVELQNVLSSKGVPIHFAPEGNRTLIQRGVKIKYDERKPIFVFEGKTINNIAYHTNMKSVNLFAESLLCLIAESKGFVGSTSNGSTVLNKYWKEKVGVGLRLSDGSGLSRNNAVSASNFTKLLKHMNGSNLNNQFRKTLPVAGKSGTLKSVCRGQVGQGRIFAKSGTMSRVKSYAGYVNSKSGKKYAFAIIVNNHTCSSRALVKKMEKIFNAMATY